MSLTHETQETDAHTEYYADYGMDFVPTEFARRLEQQRDALVGLLEFWIVDGHLQSFQDRERFRHEARAALAEVKGKS